MIRVKYVASHSQLVNSRINQEVCVINDPLARPTALPVRDHYFCLKLIHSANPKSRPVGITVFAHVVRTSVRPHFSNLDKTKQKTMFATGVTMVCPSGSLMTPVLYVLFCEVFGKYEYLYKRTKQSSLPTVTVGRPSVSILSARLHEYFKFF